MLIVMFLIIFGVFMLCGNWTGRNNPTPDDNKNKKHKQPGGKSFVIL